MLNLIKIQTRGNICSHVGHEQLSARVLRILLLLLLDAVFILTDQNVQIYDKVGSSFPNGGGVALNNHVSANFVHSTVLIYPYIYTGKPSRGGGRWR